MSKTATLAVIHANLTDRYFPEKHGVWRRVESTLEALADQLSLRLHTCPGEVADAAAARAALENAKSAGADFVLLVHGGFTMGDVGREIAASGVPLGVWTVPEPVRTGDVQLNNFVSLNMSMSVARFVRDIARQPVQWYHGAPDSPALIARLTTTLRAITALKYVTGSRIAVIGGLAPTFYNMEVSSNALRQRLGVEIVTHDMHELTGRMAAIPDGRVASELARMCAAAQVRDVSDVQMALTSRCALALRDIASEFGHDALAVSDWPALQANPGMHPGSAFSWLEDVDHIPVASEGDVLGALTQLLARALSGRLGCLLDITEPDLDTGRLLMWHGGGGPLYMADDKGAAWINHPMMGREVVDGPKFGGVADFVFRPGPHAIFRIARDASAFFRMQADVVAQDPSGFDGCRGWMENFSIGDDTANLSDVIATVMSHGLEHHFVALPGDYSNVLAEFAAWAGMNVLKRRPARNYLDLEDFT